MYDLLKMPDKDRIGKLLSEDERMAMIPNQIRTYDGADVLVVAELAKKQYKEYTGADNSFWNRLSQGDFRQGMGCEKGCAPANYSTGYFVSYVDFIY